MELRVLNLVKSISNYCFKCRLLSLFYISLSDSDKDI